MFWTNFHSHCNYCDGQEPMEAYVQKAVSMGMHAYGISCHAPVPYDLPWAMKMDDLSQYLMDVRKLKMEWQNNIEVYAGLEVDFIPGLSWWDQIGPQYREMDYVIGSVHLVDFFEDGRPWEIGGDRIAFEDGLEQIFNGDVQAAVTRYFELVRWMVMLENPDVVGHLDKIKVHNLGERYFSETATWYRIEMDKTLQTIANMGRIIEVNTQGLYRGESLDLFPSHWILERILSLGIPITLSSDAHRPEEIAAGFEYASKILKHIGFEQITVLQNGKWIPTSFNEEGLDLHWRSGGSQSA